ncbi:MAG: hypothetical protein NT018_05050 [Armatimonadetes bacterium]|nr:hypothetical protein [Armatimonadota bacterium]
MLYRIKFAMLLIACSLVLFGGLPSFGDVIYVKTTGSDINDGRSWGSPKQTIQAGINTAISGDEVWVCMGTYLECITLKNGVALYGGFVGTETNLSERPAFPRASPDANETILDGNQLGSVVTVPSGSGSGARVDGFTIRNGRATSDTGYGGGGIYSVDASPIIVNNLITSNAAGCGGGVCCYSGAPVISNNTISGNYASNYGGYYMSSNGGAIYCQVSTATISNNVIKNNTASFMSGGYGIESSAFGGGIAASGGSVIVSGNLIESNNVYADGGSMSVSAYGGGAYVSGGSPQLLNNIVKGNQASSSYMDSGGGAGGAFSSGGGIECDNCSPTISGNLVVNNWASASASSMNPDPWFPQPSGSAVGGGVGLMCHGNSATITNNTISTNTVSGSSASNGGGIFCILGANSHVANNIIAFSTAGGGIYSGGTAPALRNNDVYQNNWYNYSGVSAGAGDISADPLFVNTGGGDFHLAFGSPCINAGWNLAPDIPALDMDGQPRIMGGIVDIGADEYWLSAATVQEAKLAADDASADIDGAIVSAAFTDFFYIEADNRSSGIRVHKSGHSLTAGMRVHVIGVMDTNSDLERCIEASDAHRCDPPNDSGTVAPLGLSNRSLGGGVFGLQQGIFGGFGLNNIGLLVRLYGKVLTAESSADTFWLDDGSSVYVKCLLPGPETVDTNWQYLSATGVSSIRTFRDDFLVFDQEVWPIRSGNASVSDGWLVLQSTEAPPNGGAQVQSKEHFLYQPLEFRAEVSNWENDTSLGFERWGSGFHYAIVVTEGVLGIIRETDPFDPENKEVYLPIPGWAVIKGQVNTFKITWRPGYVALDVVDHPECSVSYSGGLVPDKPLLVRFNASNDHADTVRVDYVAGTAERLLRVRSKSEVTAH